MLRLFPALLALLLAFGADAQTVTTTINALPAAGSLTGSEVVPCQVPPFGSGSTKKCTVAQLGQGALLATNNLSDLANAATARANLGLTGAMIGSNNLSDVSNAAQARVNLGLSTALLSANNLSDVANAATARTNLGITFGTSGATIPLLNGNNTSSGNQVHTGTETFSGAVLIAVRVVTAAGAVPVSATTDSVICVNKSVGAATTVNLPGSPAAGLQFIVKDCKGDAATNNITITPAAGTIDGVATLVMNVNRQSVTLVFSGVEWIVV